ncbi:general substrate transporter [Daldinia grandis]|nr:general substrate transporter [Daldinia grandis]
MESIFQQSRGSRAWAVRAIIMSISNACCDLLMPHSLNAIQNVGQLVALPFCAAYCDLYGRRNALVTSAVIVLLGAALQGGARNTAMFIGARGVLGFGLALNITAAPLLIMELAYPPHAAPLVSIYNSLWGLGSLMAAWITYGSFRLNSDWAWRIPSLLQGTTCGIQIGLCFLVEESPRWLMSVNRNQEARDLIIKYHANGDPSDPIVAMELEEIRTALRVESENRRSTSYLSFFQTPGNRRRFFIVLAVGFFSQWSGNGIISYLVNAMVTLWSLIVGVGFALVVNRFRRRTLFLVSTAGCWICYAIWTGLEAAYEKSVDADGNGGNQNAARGVLALVLIFNFFYAIGWGTLQVTYPLEIMPFNLRARGLVFYNIFCALALIFNQYANPVGVEALGWKFYIIYDVWIFIELIGVYFLFVETTGKANLEEVAAILDGEDMEPPLELTHEGKTGNAVIAVADAH